MAYDYLGLTNKVIARMNEVPLTESSFSSSRGIQTLCKNAVNNAILQINSREYGWPFNYVQATETLVAGQTRYTLPSGTKYVNYDTFRISKDSTLGSPGTKLQVLDYVEYLEKGVDQEDDTTVQGDVPQYVFRTPDNNYGLYPYPDEAYELKFEYFGSTTQLSAATDVPAVPEQYEHIILDGATAYVYQYRGDIPLYEDNWDRFQKGISEMQGLLINRQEYVYSGVLNQGGRTALGYAEVY